jgi:aminoglycoside 3'-phosphotransferase II
MENRNFPAFLQTFLHGNTLTPITEGLSGAEVWRVAQAEIPLYYLKIATQTGANELRGESERLGWMSQRFPTPKVVAIGEAQEKRYLLTTALKGTSLNELLHHNNVLTIVKRTGEALKHLHNLPIVNCPFDMRLPQRLKLAEERIESGGVDTEDFDEERQGKAIDVIWSEVLTNQPKYEEIVITHGDFTPTNILIDPITLEVSGLIDWSRAGVADKYQDIALMLRELEPFLQSAFLEGYGSIDAPDPKRVHYYQLLDEFF